MKFTVGLTDLSCKSQQDEGCQRPKQVGIVSSLNSIQMECRKVLGFLQG